MSFWHTLADLFLPRHCVVCDGELTSTEHDLCNVCLFNLTPVQWPSVTDNPLLRMLWDKFDVEAGASALHYNTHSDYHKIFIAIKYQGCPKLGLRLASLLFPLWHRLGLGVGVDYIIPIPLSRRRQLSRGYNQALWIARGISAATGIPVCADVLVRRRHNPTQTHQGADQRWENVKGIFAARRGGTDLDGKTVLVVDDIVTTGATLCDSLRALRQAFPTVRLQVFTLGWSGE